MSLSSPLHVHASGHHNVAVSLVCLPEILEEHDGLEVDAHDPCSTGSVGFKNFTQDFGYCSRRDDFPWR